MIRRIEDLKDEEPEFIGQFAIRRDDFRLLGKDKETEMKLANDKLAPEQAIYHHTPLMNPKYGGRGIAAVRESLDCGPRMKLTVHRSGFIRLQDGLLSRIIPTSVTFPVNCQEAGWTSREYLFGARTSR